MSAAMSVTYAGWITACVAHYRCQRYVRRAVESLLNQSYPWVRVIVINDGDPVGPWRELGSISDARLVRFNLKANHGCFFCWEVARRATPDPYFMMQDADDWAAPRRAGSLLANMIENKSDLAVSAQPQFCETAEGTPYQIAVRWDRMSHDEAPPKFTVTDRITEKFVYRAPHAGLICTGALRRFGGYYGGFRVGWDTLLTNIIMMTGSISWTPEPLYFRLIRPDLLTHSTETGAETKYALKVANCLRSLYRDCYEVYKSFVSGLISRDVLDRCIQKIYCRYVTPKDQLALSSEARRLRRIML